VNMIRQRYASDVGIGKCILMMALHYMQTRPRDEEGGAVMELEHVIRWIEESYGVRLKVVSEGSEDRPQGASEMGARRRAHRRRRGKSAG